MVKGCVLVVDDSEDMRLALHDLLVNEDYCPILASNGRDALTKLEQVLPNLIVTDLVMPVLDGIGFLEAVGHNALFEDVPTILMTGSEIEPVYARVEKVGLSCVVIQKPINLRDFLELVNDGVERNLKVRKQRPEPRKVAPARPHNRSEELG
jgi:DNA-binding NtrC family response regulator